MFKLFLPLLLALGLFGIGACSHDNPENINSLNFDNKPEADIAFNQSTIDCANPNSCPSFVAGMIMYWETSSYSIIYGDYSEYKIGFCSGQLIAPDRVLTNRHCIPDLMASQNTDCLENIMVKFPATSQYPAESVQCKKILEFSSEYKQAGNDSRVLDWAVIQLVRNVNREIPEVAKKGFPDKSKFTAYPTYYTQGTGQKGDKSAPIGMGVIKEVDCTTMMDNSMIYHYRNQHSPLFVGYCDSKIIRGNSGSGVYQNGKLAGLLSFALSEEFMTVYRGFTSSLVENKIGGGTNLECIPYFNSNRPDFCYWESDKSITRAIGTDFYLVHGLVASESEKEKMNSAIEGDSNIKWIPIELKFFTSAIDDSNSYESFGSESQYKMYSSEYARIDFSKRFPFIPSCVNSNLKNDKDVTLKFPFYQARLDSVEMNERAQVKVPMELSHLSYDFNYDSVKNKFIGQIRKSENETTLNYFKEVRDEMKRSVGKCFFEERTTSYSSNCGKGKTKYLELRNIKMSDKNDGSIFENEEFIEDYPSLETIELPVCR